MAMWVSFFLANMTGPVIAEISYHSDINDKVTVTFKLPLNQKSSRNTHPNKADNVDNWEASYDPYRLVSPLPINNSSQLTINKLDIFRFPGQNKFWQRAISHGKQAVEKVRVSPDPVSLGIVREQHGHDAMETEPCGGAELHVHEPTDKVFRPGEQTGKGGLEQVEDGQPDTEAVNAEGEPRVEVADDVLKGGEWVKKV